jgi:glycosyltransferase involved in cell wall biosynthesis
LTDDGQFVTKTFTLSRPVLDPALGKFIMATTPRAQFDVSVIIPAHNEQDYIDACLVALLAQRGAPPRVEILVMANACTDATIKRALTYKKQASAKGWKLRVLRVPTPGKTDALRCADRATNGLTLIYLDADVVCGPEMLAKLHHALTPDRALYASGKLQIASARTWISRAYGRTWGALPFMQSKAVGAGLFAVNRAGRAKWDEFPNIISDDTFVRLQFTPQDRIEVTETYIWPLVEGFANLVRVRRRQDAGVNEIAQLYPHLIAHEAKPKANFKTLFIRDPVSFLSYCSVKLAVRLGRTDTKWTRGR